MLDLLVRGVPATDTVPRKHGSSATLMLVAQSQLAGQRPSMQSSEGQGVELHRLLAETEGRGKEKARAWMTGGGDSETRKGQGTPAAVTPVHMQSTWCRGPAKEGAGKRRARAQAA